MNILLTAILVCSVIIYTILSPLGGDSSFKWVLYASMVLLPVNLLRSSEISERYSDIMSKWLICFAVLFLFHIPFAKEQPLNDIILLASFFSLSVVAITPDLGKVTLGCLITIFFVEILYTFNLNLNSIGTSAYWLGFFQNANTNSIFICSVMIATLLFCPNRKIRLVILVLTLIGIIATRSRNALFIYAIICTAFLLEYKLHNYQKWFPAVLVGILSIACYYMLVIEPSSKEAAVEMLGKDQGSAGRSLQLLYLVKHFKLSLWGDGRAINLIIEKHTKYPVHNVYLASFYMLGLLISIAYIAFIYWLYKNSTSYKFKVCLLAYQFYIFFEPGYFFSVQLFSYLPMFVLCAGYYQQSSFYCINEDNYSGEMPEIPKLLKNL